MSMKQQEKKTLLYEVKLNHASRQLEVFYAPGTAEGVARALYESAAGSQEMLSALLSATCSCIANVKDPDDMLRQISELSHRIMEKQNKERQSKYN